MKLVKQEVHHFALLFGYGISAINPFIALDTVEVFQIQKILEKIRKKFCKAAISGV